MPELNLLLENKPRFSADTFSIDARARFSHMVLALVKTFATQGAPLVLLLDNVQWIDAASLQTLDHLLRLRRHPAAGGGGAPRSQFAF